MENMNNMQNLDLKENPFAAIINGGMDMPSQPSAQQKQPMQGMMQGEGMVEEDQLVKGQNPGNTKFLIGATQALENFIKNSTDREDIRLARAVISLLSRLIAKDQGSLSEQLG